MKASLGLKICSVPKVSRLLRTRQTWICEGEREQESIHTWSWRMTGGKQAISKEHSYSCDSVYS